MSFDLFAAVSSLRVDWASLSDLERAERIVPIQATGMSRRSLANALGKNESVLRHIEPLIGATHQEKALIREGKIRTKPVLRAIKRRQADCNASATHPDKALKSEAEVWANTIASWARTEFGLVHGKQVVHEVRVRLAAKRGNGLVSAGVTPSSADRIIALCHPEADDRFYFERECVWLLAWVQYAVSEPAVREAAMAAAERLLTAPTRRPS